MNSDLFFRHALELLITIPAAIIAFLPAKDHLRMKLGGTIASVLVFLVEFAFIGAAACIQFDVSSTFIILPLLLLCLEMYYLFVKYSFTKKLFCFLNAAMLCMFSTVYSVFLTAPFEPDEGPFTVRSGLICLGVAFVLILFFYKTLTVKLPYLLQEERLNGIWGILSGILLALCLVLFFTNPPSVSSFRSGQIRSIVLISFSLYPIAIFSLYHLWWWTTTRLNENARIKQENAMLNMEQKRYEELRLYMEETRTLRHDFRQHIRVITELAAEDQYNELKEYVKQFSDIVKKGYAPYCANMAVDAVAAHYSSMAEAQKTKIEWMLRLPKSLPVSEVDYCAMLGNLLENALKATAKVPEEKRRINVYSSMLSETMLGITVDNPYVGKIRFNSDHLPISREPGPGHGIGLASVRSTVERYNGTMEILTKDGLFSVNIMLYPTQSPKSAAGTTKQEEGE